MVHTVRLDFTIRTANSQVKNKFNSVTAIFSIRCFPNLFSTAFLRFHKQNFFISLSVILLISQSKSPIADQVNIRSSFPNKKTIYMRHVSFVQEFLYTSCTTHKKAQNCARLDCDNSLISRSMTGLLSELTDLSLRQDNYSI